ncbi:hypothetical protein [Wenzhouxiangella sp. EGI_FJ10305]|uniref:hypothetical protein n=1 Tax=Wenzhouxiangella sp. EGI_FJ10305 TaxID=3243768 RepID=UPI0035DEBFBB
MKHPTPHRCRYHSQRSTHWYCEPCRLPLCTACKPYAEQLPIEVDCPICRQAMQEQVADSDPADAVQTPLKNATSPPALVIAVLAAVTAALGFGSITGFLMSVPVGAALLYMMITLARRAGEGLPHPPAASDLFEIDQVEYSLRLLTFGLPFIALLLVTMAATSTALATLAWLVAAAIVPAALITAIVFESPRAALDPASISHVGGITKKQVAVLSLLSIGAVLAGAGLLTLTGGGVAVVRGLLAFTACLLALGLSSRLGMIARSHRRRLEYPAGVAPIDRPRRPEPSLYEPALLAADAEVLLQEKHSHEARQLLGKALTRYPDNPALNALFDRLVRETARPGEYRNHLERRMQRLIRDGQVAAATELWQRNSPGLDNWIPRLSETRYRLALELDELGDHQMACRLLLSLPPEDRKFSHIAEAWMEAARIMEERLDDPQRARELRKVVQQRFPERAKRWLSQRQPVKRPKSEKRQPVASPQVIAQG